MHQRRYYALGFLSVLLAVVVGTYLARDVVGPVNLPQVDALGVVQETLEDLDIGALLPSPNRTTGLQSPLEPSGVAGTPIVEREAEAQPLAPSADPANTVLPGSQPAQIEAETPAERPTSTLAPPTPTPTRPPEIEPGFAFAFLPAGPVRHSSDGCPGPSIRGTVFDGAGAPLAGVRLWRYDQWGNEQIVDSKDGTGDLGQYDFPLGDNPNVHYLQVVDAGGFIASPVLEIQHRQGDAVDAACHWVDWVRQ